MTINDNAKPFMFRDRLLPRGLHFDFMRLRCGSEEQFHSAVQTIAAGTEQQPHTFVAFSEWDAVVIMACSELYPEELNELYGRADIASAIAGTSGYFAYLWDHPINADLDKKLAGFARSGTAIMMTLRFEDWFRREIGLGSELLFCDFLYRELTASGLSGVVAHTLGWNDIVVIIHAESGEKELTRLLSQIRLLVTRDLTGSNADVLFDNRADETIFAATYTHLIGGYRLFLDKTLSLGELSKQVDSARLLVRVTPGREKEVREHIARLTTTLTGGRIEPKKMPSEMGHYSFSVDITHLVRAKKAREAIRLVADVRRFIGETDQSPRSSYAETSTILCFREQSTFGRPLKVQREVDPAIEQVSCLMSTLIPELRTTYRASGMSIHRFAAVLTTLLDHLSDPVRSSVVRHMVRFVTDTAGIIPTLERDQLEDFCHICEYAMTQATDGIVQFQHDANALGLSGRGGYSRLILATETYVQDLFGGMLLDKNVLITFGLRTGHAGVTGRFQIDVPFNVLFTPSRWYVLLHEAGHIAWVDAFAWMHETLAVFEHFEREIRLSYACMSSEEIERSARMDFLRTREIVRELFPNLLMWQLGCRGDLGRFDHLSLRQILSSGTPGGGTRELLIALVLHAIFYLVGEAELTAPAVGRDWWRIWTDIDEKRITAALNAAFVGLANALREAEVIASGRKSNSIASKRKLLGSAPFEDAVREALVAVITVLGLSGREFSKGSQTQPEAAERIFTQIQDAVSSMREEVAQYENWRGEFAQLLLGGEVLALAPRGHVWSALLLDSELETIKRSEAKATFMVSQLSAILSLWHRGVTSDDGKAAKVILYRLGLASPRGLSTSVRSSPGKLPDQPARPRLRRRSRPSTP